MENNKKHPVPTVPVTKSLKDLIEDSARELKKALPEDMRPERLVRIALTSLRTVPDLAKCTSESFLGSLFLAAQIGIEPVGGQAYLLPFRNNRKKPDGQWHSVYECQFVLGYRGIATLFYRHERAATLSWGQVYSNDTFSYEYGTSAYLRHVPALQPAGDPVAYYAIAKLKSGDQVFQVMSRQQCLEHGAKHSKTFDKKTGTFKDTSPWATSPDAMCLKTVLIQLAKLLPLSIETRRAIEADETSRDLRHGFDNPIDLPVTTDWSTTENDQPQASSKTTADPGMGTPATYTIEDAAVPDLVSVPEEV